MRPRGAPCRCRSLSWTGRKVPRRCGYGCTRDSLPCSAAAPPARSVRQQRHQQKFANHQKSTVRARTAETSYGSWACWPWRISIALLAAGAGACCGLAMPASCRVHFGESESGEECITIPPGSCEAVKPITRKFWLPACRRQRGWPATAPAAATLQLAIAGKGAPAPSPP
eukprot:COSAG01_NODE_235_length_20918_cov_41.045086_5_plen_170_part_00